jgi:hypothetical protein
MSFSHSPQVTPSISLTPMLANGVGFNDSTAPWANEYFGKQAELGAWFSNIRLPFQKSVRVTTRAGDGMPAGDDMYVIVRGCENLPIAIGGITLPPTARMRVQVTSKVAQPLEYLTLAEAPVGTSGLLLMHTLTVQSGTPNFLEGCYRAYRGGEGYPGTLLSSGTEDYFASAYYFNAGTFHGPTSGFTHRFYNETTQETQVAAYRMHTADVLPFNDGIKLVWRNGDTMDEVTKFKCTVEQGGHTVGHPKVSQVLAASWVYIF